jgi:glycerol uptake facilitator-like aquaporin
VNEPSRRQPPPRPDGVTRAALWRRLLAETIGTGLLVTIVVGSGIAAQRLSPHDLGLQLLENSTATVFGLGVLILTFGPASGAHFNPIVSAADWLLGRASRSGLPLTEVLAYTVAQVIGAIGGAVLANLMYGLSAVQISGHARASWPMGLAEAVATTGLVAVIFALARTGRGALSAAAVAVYIGSAYWFTASTSFANPAVTIGRVFSDTFAGIAPASVPAFVIAQLVGGAFGLAVVATVFPALTNTPTATRHAVATNLDPASRPAPTGPHPTSPPPTRSSRGPYVQPDTPGGGAAPSQ